MQIKDKPEIVCNDPKKKTKTVAPTPTAHLSWPLLPSLPPLYLALYFILCRPHDVALSLDEGGEGRKNVNVNQDNIITALK